MLLLLALWIASTVVATVSVAVFANLAGRPPAPANQPSCLILSPIKGLGSGLERYLAALGAQDHPDYRVLLILESDTDPAYAAALIMAHRSGGRTQVLIAGRAETCGQKVHNLLAGVAASHASDAIVVFADCDMIPPRDWLTQLTRPLALGRSEISSGYIVMVPEAPGFSTWMACLMSLGVSTMVVPPASRLCAGCATAIFRDTLLKLGPERIWKGALSDDIALSLATRATGIRIHANVVARVTAPVEHTWTSLAAYARRQYQLLWHYAPREWLCVSIALLLPVAGAAAALVATAQGRIEGMAAIAVVLIAQQVRIVLRRRALVRILDRDDYARLEPVFRMARWASPVAHLLHAALFLTSCWGRTVRWAGIAYRIDGNGLLRIQDRA